MQPDEYFRFNCSKCGDCCRNVGNSIMAESLDLYRLAHFFKMEMSEVITQYTDVAFLAPQFPVFMLKTTPPGDACVFLKESRCSVQDAKPRACRLYPLGVGSDEDNSGEWIHFIVSKKQHHFTGQQRLAGKWVNKNLTPEDYAFVNADYAYTGELARLMRNINSRNDEKILELILFWKFVSYDISENFMPQYTSNMEQLKKRLAKLSKEHQP